MSYQEKKSVINMVSTVLISAIYFWYVFRGNPLEGLTTDEELRFWATKFLILIPVAIVSKIFIYIFFAIGNAIATREKFEDKEDERDKLIFLKSSRFAHHAFAAGFFLSMITLAMDMSVSVMFTILIVSGVLADVLENIKQLQYYRKGI